MKITKSLSILIVFLIVFANGQDKLLNNNIYQIKTMIYADNKKLEPTTNKIKSWYHIGYRAQPNKSPLSAAETFLSENAQSLDIPATLEGCF